MIVADLSRFSRGQKTAIEALEIFRQKGAKLISLDPALEVPGEPDQEELFTIHTRLYELERKRTSTQVSVNMERLSAEGKLRSKPPFGYHSVGKDKDFQPIPEQMAVKEKIIQLYKGGMKINHIANKLNVDGDNKVLNPEKPKQIFYHDTVKRILIDSGLVEAKGSLAGRKPLEQRIISHHKVDQ